MNSANMNSKNILNGIGILNASFAINIKFKECYRDKKKLSPTNSNGMSNDIYAQCWENNSTQI